MPEAASADIALPSAKPFSSVRRFATVGFGIAPSMRARKDAGGANCRSRAARAASSSRARQQARRRRIGTRRHASPPRAHGRRRARHRPARAPERMASSQFMLSVLLGEPGLPKQGPPARQSRHHRADRRVDDLGDFAITQIVDLAQHHAFRGTARADRRSAAARVSASSRAGSRLGRGNAFAPQPFRDGLGRFFAIVRMQRIELPAPRIFRPAHIAQDRQQPRLRRPAAERVEVAEGAQIALLRGILRVRGIAQQIARERIDVAEIAAARACGNARPCRRSRAQQAPARAASEGLPPVATMRG